MALRDAPAAGLNPPGVRLRNKTNDIARVAIVVPAGDEIEVPAGVATQLGAAFEIVSQSPSPAPPDATEEAGGGSARTRSGRRGA